MTTGYGKDVLGTAVWEEEQRVLQTGEDIYGAAVTGFGPDVIGVEAAASEQAGARVTQEDVDSLNKLEVLLANRPLALDIAMNMELKRHPPRRGAIELFRRVEKARAGGPRKDVLDVLQAHFTAE